MSATVIPIARARETGDGDASALLDGYSLEERAVKILEHEFPLLCNDIAMLVARPFRLVWDPTIETACTDCITEVRVSPWFFVNGHREVGYGTTYHETGHIRDSPYGDELLARAEREGGPVLRQILGILLDRKDDLLTVEYAPGFAPLLRKRLEFICTMTRRAKVYDHIKRIETTARAVAHAPDPVSGRERPHLGPQTARVEQAITRMLKSWKPHDPYEDFFFAAKWHKTGIPSQMVQALVIFQDNLADF